MAISRFEEFWGYPEFPNDCDKWLGEVDLYPVPSVAVVAMLQARERFQFIKGKAVAPFTSRGRFGLVPLKYGDISRPDLTNLTDDAVLSRYEALTTSAGASEKLVQHNEKQKSPRREAGSSVHPDSSRRVSDSIHVRSYHRPSWFSSIGVSKKRKRIEAKGLPSFHNWRFITLTFSRVDHDGNQLWSGPLEAYLAGSDRMRRFLHEARKAGIFKKDAKWCWKLEFHADGWPHWHLLIERKSKVKPLQWDHLRKLWGFGIVGIERVNESGFRYNFKYAFKAVALDPEFGDEHRESFVPSWFLDYKGEKIVTVKWTDVDGNECKAKAIKPTTFARVRFWQTSRGFYVGRKLEVKPVKPQKTWTVPVPLRVVMDRNDCTVQVIARKSSGKYIASQTVPISGSLERFWDLVGFDTVNGGAVGLGVFSYVIPCHRIQTNKQTLWQLKPLLQANRLQLRHAFKLQQQGETLQTC